MVGVRGADGIGAVPEFPQTCNIEITSPSCRVDFDKMMVSYVVGGVDKI
jgi:hypothetical protein